MLAERLAVVAGHDDERLLPESGAAQLVEEVAEIPVQALHAAIVEPTRDLALAFQRLQGLIVDRHEPPAGADLAGATVVFDAELLGDRRARDAGRLVGEDPEVRVCAVEVRRRGTRPRVAMRARPVTRETQLLPGRPGLEAIALEALIQCELLGKEGRSLHESSGRRPGARNAFGERRDLGRERSLLAVHAVEIDRQARQDRGVRGLGRDLLRPVRREALGLGKETVEHRRRGATALPADGIFAKRIERNQDRAPRRRRRLGRALAADRKAIHEGAGTRREHRGKLGVEPPRQRSRARPSAPTNRSRGRPTPPAGYRRADRCGPEGGCPGLGVPLRPPPRSHRGGAAKVPGE